MTNKELVQKHAHLVSAFGHSIPAVVATTFVICSLFWLNGYKQEALLFAGALGSVPYILILKTIFKRKRPTKLDVIPVITADNYSFPSGHVVFYTVFWGFLFYLLLRVVISFWLGVFIQTFCLYMILTVGISRVVLKVHWVSDVVFGYLFGSVFLLLLILVTNLVGF